MRVSLHCISTLIVAIHLVVFALLIYYKYGKHDEGISMDLVFFPIILMTLYPIVGIPILVVLIAADLAVKKEGVLAWHRDSLGILL